MPYLTSLQACMTPSLRTPDQYYTMVVSSALPECVHLNSQNSTPRQVPGRPSINSEWTAGLTEVWLPSFLLLWSLSLLFFFFFPSAIFKMNYLVGFFSPINPLFKLFQFKSILIFIIRTPNKYSHWCLQSNKGASGFVICLVGAEGSRNPAKNSSDLWLKG